MKKQLRLNRLFLLPPSSPGSEVPDGDEAEGASGIQNSDEPAAAESSEAMESGNSAE